MSLPAPPVRRALPVQFCTVNVFAPLAAVRMTPSIPASVSLPRPVRVEGVSVKSASADTTTVSVPSPPSRLSLPAPPVNVSSPTRPASASSPVRPSNVLSLAFPRIVSASTVPMTFSIPLSLDSVSANPDTTAWAVVTARSRLTAPLASAVKSSVSVSASATSTIVTLPDSVPEKM